MGKIKILTDGGFGDERIIGKVVNARFIGEGALVEDSELSMLDSTDPDFGNYEWTFFGNEFEVIDE